MLEFPRSWGRRAFPTDHPAGTGAWRGRYSGPLEYGPRGVPGNPSNIIQLSNHWANSADGETEAGG